MSRVLITFVGSHDLIKNNNGPIEQIIKFLKPSNTYIFITSEYIDKFKTEKLEEYYKSLIEQNINVIYTDITNPTDTEEVANNISNKIDEINTFILENKYQGFLNLTSGTPAILSVLSLFAITGQLNRTMGLYAPNPKFDNSIRMNSLDYYKNSFAYQTIKNLINQCDYTAVEDFLKKNKILPKLNASQDFNVLISFAKNRAISNFDLAKELHDKHKIIQEFDYKKPENLYSKAIESLMSADISARNNDIFQTTLKLGIIRENIVGFLLQKILSKKQIDIIEVKMNESKKNDVKRFKKEILETKYPEIIKYLQKEFEISKSSNKEFDLNREINSFTEGLLLKCFIKKEDDKILNVILKELHKLDNLKSERNKIAHTINSPNYDKNWILSLKKIIINIAIYLNYSEPTFDDYKEINKELLKILKQTLN